MARNMALFRRGGRPGLIGLAARTAVVAGTASAVSGGVMRHQQRRAQDEYEQQQYAAQQQQEQIDAAAAAAVASRPVAVAAPPAPPAMGAADTDLVGQLQNLANLHAQGVLSDQEFAAAKAQLLG